MASLSGSPLISAFPNHLRSKTLPLPLTYLRSNPSRGGAFASLRARHGVRATRASAEVSIERDSREERGKGGDRTGPLRVGIVCGGPSAERGISLNSARSVLDHVQVSCYYIDCNFNAYTISSAQLYSNTPADFDFKLESLAEGFHSLTQFVEHLAATVDIVFPVIHGRFGEDGGIQELLEKASVPFVGTSSKECVEAFDKHNASIMLERHGFVTIPNFLIQEHQTNTSDLTRWFVQNQLDTNTGKVVVKPTRAGSSIGVIVAYGVDDSIRKSKDIISKKRALMTKSWWRFFLKEDMSLQLLSLMWEQLLNASLSLCFQLRLSFSCAMVMISHKTQSLITEESISQHNRLYITLRHVSLLM